MLDVKTDFSWADIRMLIKIKNCHPTRNMTYTVLCNQLQTTQFNPIWRRVKNYLIEIKALEEVETIGKAKIIKIHYKKIKDLLDEQNKINELVDEYLSVDHVFYW